MEVALYILYMFVVTPLIGLAGLGVWMAFASLKEMARGRWN